MVYNFDDVDKEDIYEMNKGKGSMYLKPDKTEKYPQIISFVNPEEANESAKTLESEFNSAKTRDKKYRVAVITQDCANQSKAFLKRKNLSKKEQKEFKAISKIYEKKSDELWAEYNKQYGGN